NALVAEGPNHIAALNQRYGIQSDYEQNGWLQPAHSERSLAKVRAVYEDWKAFGARVDWLDAGQVKAELGAAGYIGGWKNAEGAIVNPLAQCLGLARAAEAEGALIYENTRVVNIRQEDGQGVQVSCKTATGTARITAKQ